MPTRWVVDEHHPNGHAVEMTAAEQAQHDTDQAAGAAWLEAQTAALAAAAQRTEKLRDAQTALAAGGLFATLKPEERAVLALILERVA